MTFEMVVDSNSATIVVDGAPVVKLSPDELEALAELISRTQRKGFVRRDNKWCRRLEAEVKNSAFTGKFLHCEQETIPQPGDYLAPSGSFNYVVLEEFLATYDMARDSHCMIIKRR